jgi:DNA-directed RNA polymerase specialized sigma24 family protein
MTDTLDRHAAEARFRDVFSHLGAVAASARRRGNNDADAVAAEVMTIAWRRLADVPVDDPRPWLYATARNLLLAERPSWRSTPRSTSR